MQSVFIKAPGVVAAPAPSLPVVINCLPWRLCLSTIIWIEAMGNSCQIVTRDGHRYPVSGTLSTLAQAVPEFWRIHRSYLVNPVYVLGSMGSVRHLGLLKLLTGEQVPVSRRRKDIIYQHLMRLTS